MVKSEDFPLMFQLCGLKGAHWESTNPFCQKCARQCHQLWLSGDKILCQKDNHQRHLVQQVDKTIEKFATAQPGEDHTALTRQVNSYQAPTIELDQSPPVTEEAMVHNY